MKRPQGQIDEKDERDITDMPQKRFFRSRAHCNPLSNNDGFSYPETPKDMDWSPHFPNVEDPVVRIVDIGCGFGGLTVSLAALFPETCVVGFEIRAKVCEFVRLRILALRKEFEGQYQAASCERTNCMRYMPNYFEKGQLQKMFFCFPDPHFKAKNHRRRIISDTLLSEYAYFLQPGGRLYAVTDVKELHDWHVAKLSAHPCFVQVAGGSRNTGGGATAAETIVTMAEEGEVDPCIAATLQDTEESKKVARNNGKKYYAVFRRLDETEVCKKQPNWMDALYNNSEEQVNAVEKK